MNFMFVGRIPRGAVYNDFVCECRRHYLNLEFEWHVTATYEIISSLHRFHVYVFLCMYIYANVHLYVYVYMHTIAHKSHVNTHACMHVSMQMQDVHMYVFMCKNKCISSYTYSCVCMRACACVPACAIFEAW
jgi:hypothetical protein